MIIFILIDGKCIVVIVKGFFSLLCILFIEMSDMGVYFCNYDNYWVIMVINVMVVVYNKGMNGYCYVLVIYFFKM